MGRKVRCALNHDLLPIYCVGETIEERRGNRTERVIKRQLEAGFEGVRVEDSHRFTVAYEPVWAIGTGETATTEQAAHVHKMIRKWILQRLGDEAAQTLRVIYGGSVKPDNAKELMSVEDIDGLLVGGASLTAESFLAIAEAAGC